MTSFALIRPYNAQETTRREAVKTGGPADRPGTLTAGNR